MLSIKKALLLVLSVVLIGGSEGWVDIEDIRPDPSIYNIGIGIHDSTGPTAGVNMMGYANPSQINKGIHMRLYSRAYIIDDGLRRLVFVSVDCGMMGQLVKFKALERLQETFGDTYTDANVIMSGTHTHSGPAGYLQYLLYDITSLGFIDETMQAMVEGIYQSIVRAHNNVKMGYIYVIAGELVDANINRSPAAYDNNPEEEKAQYDYDTDKTMTLLRFVDINGKEMGMVNWYAVHPTSMNNTNSLTSGDNKGYASQLFEAQMNPGEMPGEGLFVAAFAQSNCGDVSPNTNGPHCQDTGLPCDVLTSTCNNRTQLCIASGPGKDMMESTKIIGEKQFEKAWELYNNKSSDKLSGPVQYVNQYIDMGDFPVTLENGTEVRTCEPALGYSFAGGTTDGPGAFNFTQGITEENPFWNSIVNAIVPSRPEQVACQHPKPVLLDTGNYNRPYAWHPRIIETQVGRLGQFFILAVPGEFTTMAGRRLRNKVSQTAVDNGLLKPIPVIAGHANTYTHYIATIEEYDIQRYEAASTLYGPHTLEAYLQQYSFLVDSLAKGTDVPKGTLPPDLYAEQVTLLPGVRFDSPANGKTFGHVVAQPYPLAYTGETQVTVFVAGHPRNDVRLGKTFLAVEKQMDDDSWQVIATDSSWQTRFMWDRTSTLLGSSEVVVYWDIPSDAEEGVYRIKHFGNNKNFTTDLIEEYEGVTEPFKVKNPSGGRERSNNHKPPISTDPFSFFKAFLV